MSIGEALAQARRRAGLTVTQISQRTGIREQIIRDIEHDECSGCGDFDAQGEHPRHRPGRQAGTDPGPPAEPWA